MQHNRLRFREPSAVDLVQLSVRYRQTCQIEHTVEIILLIPVFRIRIILYTSFILIHVIESASSFDSVSHSGDFPLLVTFVLHGQRVVSVL